MKKFMLLIIFLFSAFAVTLTACSSTQPDGNGQDNNVSSAADFNGITMDDLTVTYDGNEHTVLISGELPEGTEISYKNNTAVNAGVYKAVAVVSAEGYNSLTLNSTLTIVPAQFDGIKFNDKTFIATGSAHEITVEGNLPDGTEVTYKNNTATAAGIYNASATLTNPNYESLTLNATLTVKSIGNAAAEVVTSLMDKPDAWSFMPEALHAENMAYTAMPVSDFTNFVPTSEISKKIIGKQLNVLYEGLQDTETLLGYLDNVFAAGATIAEVYQTYINNNPDNYAQFSGNAGGFKIQITLDGQKSRLLAGNNTVSMELAYDGETGERCGSIRLTDGAEVRYISSENYLKLAISLSISGVGNLKQIEFVRSENAVAGYLHEYTGTETKNLKTTAVIASDSTKTVIMSDKRESDDLIINGYEEVYDSRTGIFIGSEVRETVKAVDFDTLWFMLGDVSGFETVKTEDTQNDLNADTVYVNGADTAFVSKKVGGLNLKTASRRYDIEMKEVWYVIAEQDGDQVKYTRIKTEIPMLFVQIEQTDTFGKDVNDANGALFATAPSLPLFTAVTTDYEVLQELFTVIKERVTYADITAFIGDKDEFFSV